MTTERNTMVMLSKKYKVAIQHGESKSIGRVYLETEWDLGKRFIDPKDLRNRRVTRKAITDWIMLDKANAMARKLNRRIEA